MSAHIERARVLLAQSRPGDAEREAMLALAAEPQNAGALALLALSRVAQDRHQAALSAAEEAVGLEPATAYFHYVHALVLHRLDRDDDAFAAAHEALRLDPDDPDVHSMLASVELARRNWPASLEASERALAIDPGHLQAANLRSMALVRMGRKAEAMVTVDDALARDPDNALSHANQGWNCLHNNDPKQAQEYFREALRLDPSLDYAREGMLQALNARNPVYKVMLAYFLWMGRLSGGKQGAVVVGVWFASRFVRGLAATQPSFAWLWWTVLAVLYAFVYLSWTAQPMFNLLLRLDRFGRHVLSDDQRVATNWFGALFGSALISFGVWLARGTEVALWVGLGGLALSICVAATFNRTGRSRTKLALASGALALVGIAALAAHALGRGDLEANLGLVFIFGFLGFQLAANFVTRE